MREVQLYNHPVTEPGFCGKCGSQDRDWFVDLGFDTIFNRPDDGSGAPTWTDGTIYLCSECYRNLVTDVNRRFEQFLIDVPVTHRLYTTPVGLEDEFQELIASKINVIEITPVGPVEYVEEDDGYDDDFTGSDSEAADFTREDDRESEPDDFGFRIEVESAELMEG